eukprot:CAMPEP_0198255872 /NCGR_PEP_ID=MMETSP1447-20131203/5911_1 /TAXON_ID=420782 /ORGANISM="Chaetoceros dichaeta, Strain CCMP1751" /LENGTH=622 /DNA_ID=CAMNT_0043942361 /DNA_START=191 /DNA_END=2059 /DNA_ORIENTATION=-
MPSKKSEDDTTNENSTERNPLPPYTNGNTSISSNDNDGDIEISSSEEYEEEIKDNNRFDGRVFEKKISASKINADKSQNLSGTFTAVTSLDSDESSLKRSFTQSNYNNNNNNGEPPSDDDDQYFATADDDDEHMYTARAPTKVPQTEHDLIHKSPRSPPQRKDSTLSGTIRLTSDTKRQLMHLLVTGQTRLAADTTNTEISDALKRRLRDFRFAQKKRVDKYGQQLPWGIIGLYDHLTGIRTDVEWAEDAAWRRENEEPYLSWTDFEEAKDTGLNRPFFTYGVMLVCTVCLVVSIGLNGWTVEPLVVNPMIGPSAQTLIAVGAKQTSLIVEDNEWYRLFTPMLLHAGVIHYFVNMLALWFIGYAVEQSHGFIASAILFMIPAVGGTIISALFLPEYISVGASGGIFGLIGACLADIFSNWNLLFSKEVDNSDEGTRFRHIKVLLWLFLDILLNILIGLTPFVDNFTHLGGMVYGFLCGLSTMERLSKAFFGVEYNWMSKFQVVVVKFFGIILSLILIIVSLVILANGDGTQSCHYCRFVSCVPFPFWAPYDQKWWYCDDCDLVTADARQNKDTNYYAALNLTCPDGVIESIDLTGEKISDRDWLRKQLPNYCRESCDELYSH